ncbi:MAG TPA: hypothetical protein VI893_05375, partial [Thermoplasmata archaeon]|nr:hypothetical protein [Thermoplasmata archaeon]
DALLLATPAGLMLHGWLREPGKFDPDSVTGMLTAVSAFVRESVGLVAEEGPWKSQTITVGPRTVVSVSAGELIATAVVAGRSTPELCGELKRLVGRSDPRYKEVAAEGGAWVQCASLQEEFSAALGRVA